MSNASQGSDRNPDSQWISLEPSGPSDARPFESWWQRYEHQLQAGGLSKTAVKVIRADCEYIVDKGILRYGPAGDDRWPSGRLMSGLVMGAVQSGKTASMIGVVACALDRGINHIVILGGTRIALHEQTLRRFIHQLDLKAESWPSIPEDKLPIVRPDIETYIPGSGAKDYLYSVSPAHYRMARKTGRPLVIVARKNPQNLKLIQKMFRNDFGSTIESTKEPTHLLVIDDEADDGSVLDSGAEERQGNSSSNWKWTPREIFGLWAKDRSRPDNTWSAKIYATYLAYTATPQANFLQSDHLPLAPKDFVFALRTPYDIGEHDPRDLTFREPNGLNSFYTGGTIFYDRLKGLPIAIPMQKSLDEEIAIATKNYLVAGAIKLWMQGGTSRLMPSAVASKTFDSLEAVKTQSPKPHSMLIHPSAETGEHFEVANAFLSTVFGADDDLSLEFAKGNVHGIPRELIEHSIETDEENWIEILKDYFQRSKMVRDAFDLAEPPPCPPVEEWDEIKRLIIDEVAPNIHLSVVNSDPDADSHPNFEPIRQGDSWLPRTPLFSIFVSGNVMSRGLTLEGLTTTVFSRGGVARVADTRMQMQRWFGYRGSEIHLTKVFLHERQLQDFTAFHEDDVYLRSQIIAEMNQGEARGLPPDLTVLQGERAERLATGKIQNVGTIPLCVGAYPRVQFVNKRESVDVDPNLAFLDQVFQNHEYETVAVGGRSVGIILKEPRSLLQAADLLDSLRFDEHLPRKDGWDGKRWERLASVVSNLNGGEDVEFYRPPTTGVPTLDTEGRIKGACPYSVAAYFRLWNACLSTRVPGLFDSASRGAQWNLVDLERKHSKQPVFHIGIKFGDESQILDDERLSALHQVVTMTVPRSGTVQTSAWGSQPAGGVAGLKNDGTYYGDKWFDYHFTGQFPTSNPPMRSWRPEGDPGLILFNVVQTDGAPAVRLGLGIPVGGPEQFAARVSGPNG